MLSVSSTCNRKNPRLLHKGLTHACRDRHLPRSVHRRQAYIQDSAVGDITCPVLKPTLAGSGNLQIPPSHVVSMLSTCLGFWCFSVVRSRGERMLKVPTSIILQFGSRPRGFLGLNWWDLCKELGAAAFNFRIFAPNFRPFHTQTLAAFLGMCSQHFYRSWYPMLPGFPGGYSDLVRLGNPYWALQLWHNS